MACPVKIAGFPGVTAAWVIEFDQRLQNSMIEEDFGFRNDSSQADVLVDHISLMDDLNESALLAYQHINENTSAASRMIDDFIFDDIVPLIDRNPIAGTSTLGPRAHENPFEGEHPNIIPSPREHTMFGPINSSQDRVRAAPGLTVPEGRRMGILPALQNGISSGWHIQPTTQATGYHPYQGVRLAGIDSSGYYRQRQAYSTRPGIQDSSVCEQVLASTRHRRTDERDVSSSTEQRIISHSSHSTGVTSYDALESSPWPGSDRRTDREKKIWEQSDPPGGRDQKNIWAWIPPPS